MLTIYGNHEKHGVLTRLHNIKDSIDLPVFMEDSEIYELCGLRIAGINDIIGRKKKS